YRRQSQVLFGEMQLTLRHDVLRSIFHARPVAESELDRPIETELTRAARSSVDNADRIIEADSFDESDFDTSAKTRSAATKPVISKAKKQKQRKAERQRKKSKRRK